MKKAFVERIETKITAAFGQQARLVGVETLAGDASSRRYHRARLRGAAVPPSLIIMELAGSALPLSSEELSVFPHPPEELPFLNLHRFLWKVGVRIPALYGHWVEEGLLFLEDGGDICLWDVVRDLPPQEVAVWYEKAIEELLCLQVQGTRARDESCLAFQQRFDLRLYMWEFTHFIEYGIEKGRKGSLGGRERKELEKAFTEISQRLEGLPPYLNHRDYHSWNLMVHQGELVVIDFQDALLAPPQYDLASLLNDRETDSVISPELEETLLDHYQQRWVDAGEPQQGKDEFLELYLLSTLQRDFKVVGRFEYLHRAKGKPGYRKFLPPTLRRLRRNLRRLPQTEKLPALLAPYFEEMR